MWINSKLKILGKKLLNWDSFSPTWCFVEYLAASCRMLADVMAHILLVPATQTIASKQVETKNLWDFQQQTVHYHNVSKHKKFLFKV